MYKIDLHCHSKASPDGSLDEAHYKRMLESGRLNYIAVTDHDKIDFAKKLQSELGERIIIGEEISSIEGEVIGLYLKEAVPPGLNIVETVKRIRQQNGLVYVPHPFETARKGLTTADLEKVADQIDIIETYNGRTVQNRSAKALEWAKLHEIPGAASSDSHGWHGWGKTYSVVAESPTKESLAKLLASATYEVGSPGIRGRLYPKANRLRKKLKHA